MATYEYSCRLLKPDRRGSIQPGIRVWDPLHWNYTALIPTGAKLPCEYGRLLSLSGVRTFREKSERRGAVMRGDCI